MIPDRIRRHIPGLRFPRVPAKIGESSLFKGRWYYSVELSPGLITNGQYPDDFPMLPRMMLRKIDLKGATCLDLGSMEGLIPVLMCRQGAKSVLATDAIDHCAEKMAALRHYYSAHFDFLRVGLMYDLTKKLREANNASFDVINLSGVLYHVFSPLMVLAGVRPLLKKNGIIIVSTNVVLDDSVSMHLNDGGRFQEESNTFWYTSIKALDYMLRYLKLAPIDCLYLPHQDIKSSVRYVSDINSGYCSIVCRATEDVVATAGDNWMRRAAAESWEYKGLIDWEFYHRQPESSVSYSGSVARELFRSDIDAVDLWKAASSNQIHKADRSIDAHILKLADQS